MNFHFRKFKWKQQKKEKRQKQITNKNGTTLHCLKIREESENRMTLEGNKTRAGKEEERRKFR